MTNLDIALVGATGLVGSAILEQLESREFGFNQLFLLASEHSVGTSINVAGKHHTVAALPGFDFSQVQLVLFATDQQTAHTYVPQACAAGCLVIDSSAAFRNEPDVPLAVAAVNPDVLIDYPYRNLVSTPDALALAIATLLTPVLAHTPLEQLQIATYQSVSAYGKAGVTALANETAALLNARPVPAGFFPEQIAFNLIPQVGELYSQGYCEHELVLMAELHKLLPAASMSIDVSSVLVPVFHGHGASISLETQAYLGGDEALELWQQHPEINVLERATPVGVSGNTAQIAVSRVRESVHAGQRLNLWLSVDNVRYCAALNSIKVAEILRDRHF